jgi:uncharacterized protein (TIGR03118 family)
MKNMEYAVLKRIMRVSLNGVFILFLILTLISSGCKKKSDTTTTPPPDTTYLQVNLAADTAGVVAKTVTIDQNLKNAWGIAIGPTGNFWISCNHAGLATIYDRNGTIQQTPVAIPSQGTHFGGSPSGVVYNSTADFIIPANGETSKFIFVQEDGTISAWSSGDSTIRVADWSAAGAVFKGATIANDGSGNFLYAANFRKGKIEVFDHRFKPIANKPFTDPTIPAGFNPFNIKNIGGKLFVTYAKIKPPDSTDDQSGPGNGYVDIFNPDGSFVKRFASQGTLNSPWGIEQAPAGFNQGQNAILVGNFGDGRINVYDSTGIYKGQLKDKNGPIAINGLWAIIFPQNNIPAGDQNQLFFTAGPQEENHGLFGYLKLR